MIRFLLLNETAFRALSAADQYKAYAEAASQRARLFEALRSLVKAEEDYGDPANAAINEAWGPASELVATLGGK